MDTGHVVQYLKHKHLTSDIQQMGPYFYVVGIMYYYSKHKLWQIRESEYLGCPLEYELSHIWDHY